jgi:hypothetical protein
MRYLIWVFGLICQTSLAQSWRVQVAWQSNHTSLVRSDLPSQLTYVNTEARHGGIVGVERDLGQRWWVGGYFSLGEMDYRVRGWLSQEIELSGTYKPRYRGHAFQTRLGYVPWQSRSSTWKVLLHTGLSVHWVQQNGHDYTTLWFVEQQSDWG